MKLNTLIATAAVLAAVGARAEGEEAAPAAEAASAQNAAPAKTVFTTLPVCSEAEGFAEVLKPGAAEWAAAEIGRYYPLGSAFRVGREGKLILSFAKKCTVSLEPKSSFGTRAQPIGEKSRTIVVQGGTCLVNLPDNLPEGMFVVTAPSFTVRNPAGQSKFVFTDMGDGSEALVRCVTGTMEVEGRHFAMPKMRAADEFRIRASHDNLETIIYGLSGDYIVKLDQGNATTYDINDSGERIAKVSPRLLEWHLSPQTRVQINRAVPSVGERMSVHTMAFDAAGEMKSECCFCEGRAEVNSGELVVQPKPEGEEVAKEAAQATEEAVTTEESATDEKASKETNNNNNESSEE